MTENEFLALARAGYNRIPLHLETLADLDTPLSIYLKLANRPGSYLLESVIGGERFGRVFVPVSVRSDDACEAGAGLDVSTVVREGTHVDRRVTDHVEHVDVGEELL